MGMKSLWESTLGEVHGANQQLHVLASLSVPAAVDNDENGDLKSTVFVESLAMVLFIALATSSVWDKLLWACRLQSSGHLRL